ncbi:MAG: hypothetical protein AMDU4_FER2C00152G0002 [Ferroplasma sp. Type II]|nr:MAG: hypothetical protein AMDU4_FER2C00152G0002 [Ferroplasma sp. Type II]
MAINGHDAPIPSDLIIEDRLTMITCLLCMSVENETIELYYKIL